MPLFNSDMKKVKFKVDETKKNPISGIAIVDEPAIESNFKFFSKEKQKPKYYELKSEKYKQVVHGPVLIPNKEILRVSKTNEPYVGIFEPATVEKLQKMFMKNANNNEINVGHTSEDANTYLFESIIVDNEDLQKGIIARGIPEEDVPLGTWYASMHVEDKEVFEKVVSGELNGFSIEAWLTNVLVSDSEENNLSKTVSEMIDNKFKSFLSGLKTLLADAEGQPTEEKKEQKLESAKTSDGKSVEYGAEGEAVNIVSVDAEGKESKAAAPDGTHVLDNGKQIEVKDGLLVSIADAPKEEEAKKEEAAKETTLSAESVSKYMKEKFGKSVYANYTLADGKEVSVTVSEINEVYSFDEAYNRTLLAAGDYELKDGGKLVVGDGGKFVSVDTSTVDINSQPVDAELKKEFASIKSQIEKLKAENEALKKVPLAKPVVTKPEELKKKKDYDYEKLSNADKQRLKYGLELVDINN